MMTKNDVMNIGKNDPTCDVRHPEKGLDWVQAKTDRRELRNKNGVYWVYWPDGTMKVGKSNNLSQRLGNHMLNRGKPLSMHVCLIQSPDDMKAVEGKLIAAIADSRKIKRQREWARVQSYAVARRLMDDVRHEFLTQEAFEARQRRSAAQVQATLDFMNSAMQSTALPSGTVAPELTYESAITLCFEYKAMLDKSIEQTNKAIEQRDKAWKELEKAWAELAETKAQLNALCEYTDELEACEGWQLARLETTNN